MQPTLAPPGAVSLALALLVSLPLTASAQPTPGDASARLFAGGGVAVDDDHTLPDATSAGIGLAHVGIDLRRHIGMRLALDVPTLDDTNHFPAERDRPSWSASSTGIGN
jgi:hypothetical protein